MQANKNQPTNRKHGPNKASSYARFFEAECILSQVKNWWFMGITLMDTKEYFRLCEELCHNILSSGSSKI